MGKKERKGGRREKTEFLTRPWQESGSSWSKTLDFPKFLPSTLFVWSLCAFGRWLALHLHRCPAPTLHLLSRSHRCLGKVQVTVGDYSAAKLLLDKPIFDEQIPTPQQVRGRQRRSPAHAELGLGCTSPKIMPAAQCSSWKQWCQKLVWSLTPTKYFHSVHYQTVLAALWLL